jgi:hypothetical protein
MESFRFLFSFSLEKARVFVSGEYFQLSLIFAGKARSLPKSGAPEMRFTLGSVA